MREIFNAKRIECDQTYDALVEKSGLARQTLLNISSGKYRGDLRTWVILARVWNEPLDTLLAPIWDD
nr:XRE family transcriptional regulator [Microbacterium lacticum]